MSAGSPMFRDVGRSLEIHSGGDPARWHIRSRRPDVPRTMMRAFWVLYSVFVFMGPLMGRGTFWDWSLAVASIGVFLPFYVGYWWAIDHHRPLAMAFVVAIALLGFAFVPINAGATTYIIYSAALVGFAVQPRVAVSYLAGLAVVTFLIGFAYAEPARSWVRLPTIVMVAMIGGGNLFYAENARRNAQ